MWSGWYEKGKWIGVVFGQAREGFMEEVNLYPRLMEVRKLALADTHRKRAFQAEKEKNSKSWNGNVLRASEKHQVGCEAGVEWGGAESRSRIRVGIIQSIKLLSFCVEVGTGSTHRVRRASGISGDMCILSVHPSNPTDKESEAQERETNCLRSQLCW